MASKAPCLIRSHVGDKYTTYCGRTQHSNFNLVHDENRVNLCSKCSSRFNAERIKAIADFPYRLGDRLDLSNDPRRWDYKSIYEIIRNADDAVLGFVTIKNGWGKDWDVRSWMDRSLTLEEVDAHAPVPAPFMAAKPVGFKREPDDRFDSMSFCSKEQALLTVPLLVEQGKLPSRDEVIAEATKTVEELRRRHQVQTEQLRLVTRQRAEQKQMIKEEFTALLATGTLTNAQHVALTTAADLLGIDL